MADIDPITREALRRAAQMQGRPNQGAAPPEAQKEHREHNHKPPKPHDELPPESEPRPPDTCIGLDALFKDKETSVILILIMMLMDCEHLLLALIYLLI